MLEGNTFAAGPLPASLSPTLGQLVLQGAGGGAALGGIPVEWGTTTLLQLSTLKLRDMSLSGAVALLYCAVL